MNRNFTCTLVSIVSAVIQNLAWKVKYEDDDQDEPSTVKAFAMPDRSARFTDVRVCTISLNWNGTTPWIHQSLHS